MNLVIATGRVGIVDSRNTKDGTPVTSVSVAMNERWTKDGQAVEKTTWIRFTFWRKEAEIARRILNTGDLVTLTGKLEQPSTFQNKQGQWVAALKATGQSIEKLSKKGEHGNGQQHRRHHNHLQHPGP